MRSVLVWGDRDPSDTHSLDSARGRRRDDALRPAGVSDDDDPRLPLRRAVEHGRLRDEYARVAPRGQVPPEAVAERRVLRSPGRYGPRLGTADGSDGDLAAAGPFRLRS